MQFPRFLLFWIHVNLKTLRRLIDRSGQQRLPGLAAEMAYSLMLGLFPGVLSILTAIGIFTPLRRTLEQLVWQLRGVIPDAAMGLIQGFADDVTTTRDTGLFSISFAIAIWVTSGALSAAMSALDQIHQIPRDQIRPFWKAKLVALILTIGSIFLVMVAVAIVFISSLLLRQLVGFDRPLSPWILWLWQLANFPIALGVMSMTFGFIYRFGPSRWNPGKPIMPGAIVAAILWAIGSNLFRLYVANFADYNRTYGAVGAVIVMMLWLYLSSLAMLLGDQLNMIVGESMPKHLARTRKSKPNAPS
jgi:membrane protein